MLLCNKYLFEFLLICIMYMYRIYSSCAFVCRGIKNFGGPGLVCLELCSFSRNYKLTYVNSSDICHIVKNLKKFSISLYRTRYARSCKVIRIHIDEYKNEYIISVDL